MVTNCENHSINAGEIHVWEEEAFILLVLKSSATRWKHSSTTIRNKVSIGNHDAT